MDSVSHNSCLTDMILPVVNNDVPGTTMFEYSNVDGVQVDVDVVAV